MFGRGLDSLLTARIARYKKAIKKLHDDPRKAPCKVPEYDELHTRINECARTRRALRREEKRWAAALRPRIDRARGFGKIQRDRMFTKKGRKKPLRAMGFRPSVGLKLKKAKKAKA